MLKPTDRVVLVLGILQITLLTPLDPRAGGLLVVRVAHALFSSRVRSVVSATFAANVTSLQNDSVAYADLAQWYASTRICLTDTPKSRAAASATACACTNACKSKCGRGGRRGAIHPWVLDTYIHIQ